jgi:alanine racemase
MTRPVRARIDVAALQHNLNQARKAAPRSRVLAVIKANGYGHGLTRTAQALAAADGFGVARLDEAMALREAGITGRIVLLEGCFDADELTLASRHALEVTVHHSFQVEMLERHRPAAPVRVWLKVDTGMHRLGIAPDAVNAMYARLRASTGVVPEIALMTHLANADDRDDATTSRQLACFDAAVAGLPGERSIANSAGILGWPATHAEWVRPGIMLYGASPFTGGNAGDDGLLPVMTLSTQLIAINSLRRGDPVGYGGDWVCPEDMRVGVAAIGYGDGYPRHARGGTPVLLRGRRMPLIGRVSMDMICLDLRDADDATIGDRVVLWGEGLPVDEIAACADTISYQLLCGVTARVRVE